jgi:hypothetical protein
LYLQFLDLYGNPTYVRPERVDALRGIPVTFEGRPCAGTLLVMTNRETFRVRGHVDTIHDALVAWHTENEPKAPFSSTAVSLRSQWLNPVRVEPGCPDVVDCVRRPSVNVSSAPVDADNTL